MKIVGEIEPATPAIAKKNASSKRDYYFQKLNAVEASLSDLEDLYEGGITDQIKEAVIETIFRWDKLLNEIYGEFKIQLTATEMDYLRPLYTSRRKGL